MGSPATFRQAGFREVANLSSDRLIMRWIVNTQTAR
jgi:hypothetical protein